MNSNPIQDRARGTVAALVVILAALAVASLYTPPLGGIAAVAMVLGVLGVALVARGEAQVGNDFPPAPARGEAVTR